MSQSVEIPPLYLFKKIILKFKVFYFIFSLGWDKLFFNRKFSYIPKNITIEPYGEFKNYILTLYVDLSLFESSKNSIFRS